MFAQSRFSDVETDEDNLFVQEGERDGEVGDVESLAFSRGGGGEHHDVLAVFKHELQVGTHGTEHLFHLVVLVFMHNYAGLALCTLVGDGNVCQDGQTGQSFHIVAPLDFVAKHLDEEQDDDGDGKPGDEAVEQYHVFVWAYFPAALGPVYQLPFVSRRSQ